jgi:hypothetical protein
VKGSVQDYWYYLLSEGGPGVNDNGDSYNVEGIGMEKATDIVYRNLTLYLIPSTTFADARQGSIQAALDLYGACSNEVLQVINAWHAVGLGPDGYSNDLSLERIVSPAKDCGLTNSEIVEVEIKYHANGCNGVIQAGTEVELTYQIDNDPPVSETWILAESLEEGESYFYSFSDPINIPPVGDIIELSVWMDYAVDGISFNDALLDFEVGLKQELTESVITFENGTDPETYYYVHTGENAVAEITSTAANSGTKGFSLSSGVSFPGSISADTSLNFDVQKSRVSEICFCVDAQDWEYVSVNFDLKQTHSMLYNHFYGNDSTEFVSSMRMMVNGEQFGAQFYPDTYLDDPYLSYSYSLDQFDLAGSNFEFCFQSRNQVNDAGDNSPFFPYDSDGDNTYLDNIRFADEELVSVEEIELIDLSIYPNPTQGQVTLDIGELKEVSIDVYGVNGRLVYHQEKIIGPTYNFDLSGAPGIYILELNALGKQKRFKLIKN